MNLKNSSKTLAVLACALCLAVCIAPAVSDDVEAADYYRFEIHADGTVSGTYSSIGSGTEGYWSSADGSNVGSWGFNSDGYGPFNSFYAAFDPYNGNAVVCILDPNDLTRSIKGEDVSEYGYNIMWVLPTVYWSTETDEDDEDDRYLVLTDDPSSGNPYAHRIDGHVYDYLAIGVYEASTILVDGETYLASVSGAEPVTGETRSTYREWADAQEVDGGYAMVWNFYQYEAYKFCATIVMGGFDSQSIAGNGNVTGGSTSTAGSLDQAGPYAGTTGSDTASPVKVFIENVWGSAADMVDGVVVDGRMMMHLDSSSSPADSDSGTYVNDATPSLADTGWGTGITTTERIWGLTNESSQDYEDSLTHDMIVTSSGEGIVVVGGGYDASDYREYGLYYMDTASLGLNDSSPTTGARLAFVYDGEGEDDDGSVWTYVAIAVVIIVVLIAAVAYWYYMRGRTSQ